MKMKVVVLLVVVIYASWAMLMFAPANCQDTLIFDVAKASKSTYSQLITTLRSKLKDPTGRSYFGVPMLPAKPSSKYLYVVLTNGPYSITLAIDKSHVYLFGYLDSSKRARFLSDTPSGDKATIFDKPSQVINLPFSSQYKSIEKYAGKSRQNIEMSLVILGSRIKTLCTYDTSKKIDNKVEAEFILLAIQMVSEAVRSAYIETFIGDRFLKSFKPDGKMIELEEEWGKMSKRIAAAKTEKEVQDIIGYMGLLNYVPPKKSAMQLATENFITSIGLNERPGLMTS